MRDLKSFDSQRTWQIGDVFIISSWLSLSSGTKPLPPHVGHRRSSSVPFSTTPSPLQSGQVFMCASCTCYHTPLMRARPWHDGASPLYARKQTFAVRQRMSALGQRTSARLIDQLVGVHKECFGNFPTVLLLTTS